MSSNRQSSVSILLMVNPNPPTQEFTAADAVEMAIICMTDVDDADEMGDREWRDTLLRMSSNWSQVAMVLSTIGAVELRKDRHPLIHRGRP